MIEVKLFLRLQRNCMNFEHKWLKLSKNNWILNKNNLESRHCIWTLILSNLISDITSLKFDCQVFMSKFSL